MFSKAQRFNSKGVGCGADAVYNPKDLDKPIGGVIPKGDRFESKSDTESLHSEKSSLLFRTPKAVKPLGLVASAKRQPAKKLNSALKSFSTDNLTRDILETKNVEIRNKDETISEYEQQIKEQNHIINKLNEQIVNHKNDEDKFSENLKRAEEQIKKMQSQIDNLKENLRNSDQNVESKEIQLKELHSKVQLIEESSLEHFNEVQNLNLQIQKANKENNQFCLALNTTRNTLDALCHRLRASDEHVEKLKLELEQLNSEKQFIYLFDAILFFT